MKTQNSNHDDDRGDDENHGHDDDPSHDDDGDDPIHRDDDGVIHGGGDEIQSHIQNQ